MRLPFTVEQFYEVFRAYNVAVWPMQILLLALALFALYLILVPRRWSARAVSAILALLWAWQALAYHLAFFTKINSLAYSFSALFLIAALIFFWHGVLHDRLQFRPVQGMRQAAGTILIGFALLAYPAWGWFAGHRFPAMPTFGLPCPTSLFTIGLLAFLAAPHPRSPLIIPVLWCLVGGQAALLLGVPQDLGLFAAAALGVTLMASTNRAAAS